MKPYMVEITVHAVVMADDESQAADLARRDAGEIARNEDKHAISGVFEIKSVADLRHGWDGRCIPYGGDEDTRLEDLLPANVADERRNVRSIGGLGGW